MKWRKLKDQVSGLPEPLRQQVLLRLGTAAAAIFLFVVLLFCFRDLRLCSPCLILAAFLIVSGCTLLRSCICGSYLCLTGPCVQIHTGGLRKRVRSVFMDVSGITLELHVRQRMNGLSVGDTIILYLSGRTPVYEKDGVQSVYSYYAVTVKKQNL